MGLYYNCAPRTLSLAHAHEQKERAKVLSLPSGILRLVCTGAGIDARATIASSRLSVRGRGNKVREEWEKKVSERKPRED